MGNIKEKLGQSLAIAGLLAERVAKPCPGEADSPNHKVTSAWHYRQHLRWTQAGHALGVGLQMRFYTEGMLL